MKSAKYHYRRWFYQAPFSLMLIGFGACLISEATMLKYGGAETTHWFLYGTIALIVFNTGISLFGDAVLHRMRYERKKEA